MKRKIFLLLTLLSLVFCPSAFAEEAQDIAPLLDARQSDVWVEGQHMGDMVLGARGAMQFIYVDAKLSKAITSNPKLENWVGEMAQFFGTEAVVKKAMFIVHLDTYKPWDFDLTKVHVAGYHLTKDDILSSSMTNPFGQLASKDEGYFAFAVPAKLIKAGQEITIGYGDDSDTWTVPK